MPNSNDFEFPDFPEWIRQMYEPHRTNYELYNRHDVHATQQLYINNFAPQIGILELAEGEIKVRVTGFHKSPSHFIADQIDTAIGLEFRTVKSELRHSPNRGYTGFFTLMGHNYPTTIRLENVYFEIVP